MVQTVRRPSQVVTFGYHLQQQSGSNNIPTSLTSATQKCSVVYRVPIQLEWQKVKTNALNIFFSVQKPFAENAFIRTKSSSENRTLEKGKKKNKFCCLFARL